MYYPKRFKPLLSGRVGGLVRIQYCFLYAIVLAVVPCIAAEKQPVPVPHGGPAIVPAVLTKAFSPATILVGASTTLTFTLSNPNLFSQLTGIGFTDMLLAGLTYGAQTGTCGGGTITVTPPDMLSLTGAMLPIGGSCMFSVVVNGNVAGQYPNVTSLVISSGGTGDPASANLSVIAPPVIAKAFNPSTIAVGATSSLMFTISNPAANPVALTGIAFTDTLQAGIVGIPSSTSVCGGGTLTVTAGSIVLTGGTLNAGASCMFSATVQGNTAGTIPNSVTVSSTNGGTGNTAMANLIVVGPPLITKAFNPAAIVSGGISTLTLFVSNPNLSTALTGVAFSDPLPAGLSIPTPNGLTNTCSGAVMLTPTSITLAPSTLAAGGSCTISVSVTGVTAGAYPNTTTAVTSTNGGTGLTASATLNISAPPITDSFQVRYATNLNIGDSFVNITNTGASSTVATTTSIAAAPRLTTAGAAGNLCVNVYTFDQSEELLSCCSCFVTPNGLQSISVKHSLISNNLTPEIPNSVVIKLLATAGGATGASCNASTPTFGTLAPGMRAWGTTLHAVPTTPVTYGVIETPFLFSDLSQGELNHLTSFCGFIQSNSSGFGICNGCTVGGLGATPVP